MQKSNDMTIRQMTPLALKSRAFQEFYEARKTGRLVAFTGSSVSTHIGYDSWTDMVDKYLSKIIPREVDKDDNVTFKNFGELYDELKLNSPRMPEDLLVDLAESISNSGINSNEQKYKENRKLLLKDFELKLSQEEFEKLPNINGLLFKGLRIRRALTLNYGLELEWERFLTAEEKAQYPEEQRSVVWKKYVGKKITKDRRFDLLSRHVPGHGMVTSKVLKRQD
ncbi:MAG: hypothetical protein L3J05_05565, partial [Robiginitomaculum sp.]|nr:hypothetical protein [Robiginitomaculum sp.]